MTAVTDFTAPTPLADAPRMIHGGRWLARIGQRMGGAALVLAAVGLWVAPGASWDMDLALMKMGLSLAIGFAGLAILTAGRAVPSIEIEIDTVRREVRLVRGKGRARTLVSRTAIADLGPAELHGNMARLWAADGALVAEVAMGDPDLRRGLTAALRDEGKL